MIAVRLERFGFEPDATWGRMILTGKQDGCVSVERPWFYNRPYVSCIPPGVYDLVEHHSRRFRLAWALVGPGVAHFDDGVATRTAILIHAANWSHELQGCIAPGTSIRMIEGSLGVSHAQLTMRKIDEHLREFVNPRIEISEARG